MELVSYELLEDGLQVVLRQTEFDEEGDLEGIKEQQFVWLTPEQLADDPAQLVREHAARMAELSFERVEASMPDELLLDEP